MNDLQKEKVPHDSGMVRFLEVATKVVYIVPPLWPLLILPWGKITDHFLADSDRVMKSRILTEHVREIIHEDRTLEGQYFRRHSTRKRNLDKQSVFLVGRSGRRMWIWDHNPGSWRPF